MLETINKENFSEVLARFTTTELETLVVKFPYFQQAHLLLAKKYQDQADPRFDQQLQLAALYTHDRDLFYSVFNDKSLLSAAFTPVSTNTTDAHKLPEIPVSEQQQNVPAEEIEVLPLVTESDTTTVQHTFELSPEQPVANDEPPVIIAQQESATVVTEVVTETTDSITLEQPAEEETQPAEVLSVEETIPVTEPEVTATTEEATTTIPAEEFNTTVPHTFGEWLQAYSTTDALPAIPLAGLQQPEIPAATEKQDEELEKLYIANIPVNLHELVEEETNYSKGLDKFIAEQRQKHRPAAVKTPVSDTDIDPALITETMAKVYEMQKKYTKAIRSYEILALKYPEKNDFFAARINYLKNIT